MKNIILTLFLLATISSFAQKTLSDYSYVIVPDQFEFLEGNDKYQLNSLIKYLFNKYGFHAYLNSEAPNAKRCNGLYADLKENNSFFRTKLTIVLKDCNGNTVYTGNEGNSKYKEYRKAYQDATRKAFESISALGVNQKDITLLETLTETSKNQPIAETNETVEVSTKTKPTENAAVSNLPTAKFLNYTVGETSFLLRKTDSGYSLYEESSEAENGLLLKGTISVSDNEVIFKNTNGETYDVYFDEQQNLSLFKGEEVILYQLKN